MAGAMAVDFPVLQQFDVSAARDEDMLDLLRQQRSLYRAEKLARGVDRFPVNAHLAALDPSELPSCFVASGTTGSPMGQLLRPLGFMERSHTAIRARGTAWYIGTKRAMEFRPLNGAKSDWVMIEYTLLGTMEEGRLFLQDELVLRLVFRTKNKAKVLARDDAYHSDGYAFASPDETYVDVQLPPGRRERFNMYMSSFSECLNNGVGWQPKTKRPRSTGADGQSDVWREFTKIYVQDEHGKLKLAYGVCHICDKLLKAPSSNGTKTLWRHNETCSCKQVKQQTQ